MRSPRRRMSPLVGLSMPTSMRMSVVLPEPGRPDDGEKLTFFDIEINTVDGGEIAEIFFRHCKKLQNRRRRHRFHLHPDPAQTNWPYTRQPKSTLTAVVGSGAAFAFGLGVEVVHSVVVGVDVEIDATRDQAIQPVAAIAPLDRFKLVRGELIQLTSGAPIWTTGLRVPGAWVATL